MAKERLTQSQIDGVDYRRAKLWQIILVAFNAFNGMAMYFLIGLASYSASIGYGIATLVVGGLLTFTRIFDAITDPLIASMSDRSKNKRGRRIPFMQYAAIPLSIVTVLLFCAPVEEISSINIIWISVFIVLFYLFMTMYCTPLTR